MNICEAVALRIRDLLKERNITLYRLEQNSLIQHGSMFNIVNAKNKNITLKTVMQIAYGFKMSLLEFLDDPVFTNEGLEIY